MVLIIGELLGLMVIAVVSFAYLMYWVVKVSAIVIYYIALYTFIALAMIVGFLVAGTIDVVRWIAAAA